MLSSTYGEATLSERTCRKWFQPFKNGDFDVDTGMAVEKRTFFKITNWRHYLLETRDKRKKNCRIIGSDLTSHFETPQSHGNDSEARKSGSVRAELERC